MTEPDAFVATAQSWHDFYLLTGGAAATLTGLMFVAVTFGAGLVSKANTTTVRAFIDPPLSHFVHVILTAAVVIMPTMTTRVFGALLLAGVVLRLASLVWVYRQYRAAHRLHGDMELSDWAMGIVFPALAFVSLSAAAVGFLTGSHAWISVVAAATLGVLIIGVRMAWELMLWLITEVGRKGG
jgi:hypothetical protein